MCVLYRPVSAGVLAVSFVEHFSLGASLISTFAILVIPAPLKSGKLIPSLLLGLVKDSLRITVKICF